MRRKNKRRFNITLETVNPDNGNTYNRVYNKLKIKTVESCKDPKYSKITFRDGKIIYVVYDFKSLIKRLDMPGQLERPSLINRIKNKFIK